MPAKSLRIFILLLALLPAFSGCGSPKALQYQDVQNFRVHSVDFTQVVFAMDLRFYNPNSFGLDLKNGDINTYLNNKYLGKALLDESVQMPARDTFLLPLSFQIGLTDLVSLGVSMLGSYNQELLIRMDGNVRAGKAGVFIPVPIHYEGKQLLKL